MQPPGGVYMGSTILPIVTRNASGFTAMAIITDLGQEQRGSGVLGTFDTETEAYQCAVAFGRSEIDRYRLMTLLC